MQGTLRRLVANSLILGFAGIGAWAAQGQSKIEQNVSMSLDQGWEFRQVVSNADGDAQEWLPAAVPGDVHLDLLANKKIPDPFYRDNEAKLQWIEDASWEYRLDFDVAADFLARANADLVFDGIDAAAQVFLNGALVLDADNMFRIWRVPAKDHLHVGKNELRIVFLRRAKPPRKSPPAIPSVFSRRPRTKLTCGKRPTSTAGTGGLAL